jgi:hypothetical protein
MTDNCLGKTLVEEELQAIVDKDAATLAVSQKLIDEWLPKLKADLCCVKVPRIASYFSWRHFWMKNKLVYDNISISSGMCGSWRGLKEQYISIFIYIDYDWEGDILDESVYSTLYTQQGKMLTRSFSSDAEEYTYDDFIKKLAKKIAEHGATVIRNFHKGDYDG